MMTRLFTVCFWLFTLLFCVDIISPTYTNAENFVLMACLCRICIATEPRPREVSE